MITNRKKFEDYAIRKLSKTPEEAEERYNKYKSIDPFPDIPPALLNSADIFKYVVATGMIHPFYPDQKKLKSASYSVKLLGKCLYWDEKGNCCEQDLKENQVFKLLPNSIAFVTVEPKFQLPDYIAIRFNLKISHVYKGLLLGTGPLVDPGFVGKLSIPLHNFTINPYELYGGQELIWVEFTKLSPCELWKTDKVATKYKYLEGHYYEFPVRKNTENLYSYISGALRDTASKEGPEKTGFCVRNSIPDEVDKIKKIAEDAKSEAEKIRQEARDHINQISKEAKSEAEKIRQEARDNVNQISKEAKKEAENLNQQSKRIADTFRNLSIGGLIFVIIGLAALIYPAYSLVQDGIDYVTDRKNELKNSIDLYNIKIDEQSRKIEEQDQKIEEQNKKIEEYIKTIDNLKGE